MTKRLQVYETPEITVTFDPNVCKHSGVCLLALPRVFDVRRAHWIQPEAADALAVATAIQKCPSGALQFYRNTGRDPVAASLLAKRKLINRVAVLVHSTDSRAATANAVCGAIAELGGYDFVGLYEVADAEMRAVGWTGESAPEHLRFPADQGLCGAAASTRETVIVDDVTADPRYLVTTGSTRSEMIVPVVEPASREVLGTIDVAANHTGAFGAEDRDLVEACAHAMLRFWTESS